MRERFPSNSEVAKSLGQYFYSYVQTEFWDKISFNQIGNASKTVSYVANHSFPSHVEIKNMWLYTSRRPIHFLIQCLIKHSEFMVI